jgi:glycosyltransferase involved in cell wall biosynthesis
MMQRVAKVHIWAPELFCGKGGIQTFSRHLVAALSCEVSGEKIRVLLKNDLPKDVRIWKGSRQVATFGHWPPRLRTPRFAWECLRRAYLERPQLIISTHLNFGPLAHIIYHVLHVRYILVAYGVEAWDLRRPGCLHHADKIFAISSYTRDRLLNLHRLREDRVVLLPTTFDPHVFDIAPKPAYLLTRYGLNRNQRIILTVSRLAGSERKKGYDNVIMALTRIRREIPDIHYIIVGHGDDRLRIEALITDLDLRGYVTLAGHVPDHELRDHYNLCDVFAMPSKQEGFGIVFLEALACGKPVLGGNKDGSVDALCNGELGALVDPDNVEEIVQTLLQLLKGLYPNPIVYKPEMLRQKVIDIYGFQEFSLVFSRHLRELLCLRVAPDLA